MKNQRNLKVGSAVNLIRKNGSVAQESLGNHALGDFEINHFVFTVL